MSRPKKRFLVTGGAGFIGSAFIRYGLQKVGFCERVVNFDLLTYSGNLENLSPVDQDPRYRFVQGDVCDEALIASLCREEKIDTIVHFAAESHVDRSIEGPRAFFETNVRGTFALLEQVRQMPDLHFHHVSTDEVFGSLGEEGIFNESSRYAPNSPYAASKAASDHFVRAYAHTYGLKTTLSHCTNNYGPGQFPEKFLPRMIACCLEKQLLPVYGNGMNMRDWLYVEDHAEALWLILEKAAVGAVYGISGRMEKRNIDLLHLLIQELALQLNEDSEQFYRRITFVQDRPGHDFRYAIDPEKIQRELGWSPRHTLEEGLKKTIASYLKPNSEVFTKA